MRIFPIYRAAFVAIALAAAPAAAQEATVHIGNAPSIASGALLIAIERGYFKEAGIKVTIDSLDTASNAIALLMLWTAPPPARERHRCGCC